ncbi:MAG: hypothetical protein HDR82_09475 [Bacteroides sp.]|nr:hypothetical protein [Bacteroides sp.]
MKTEPKHKCPHCGGNVDKVVADAIEAYEQETERELERIANEPVYMSGIWNCFVRAFSKDHIRDTLEFFAWLAATFLVMAAIIFFAVKCSPDIPSSTKTEIVMKGGQK